MATFENKTFSVLDFYYELISKQKVSIFDLDSKYEKDIRTIQRYVKVIQEFINHVEIDNGVDEKYLSKIIYSKKDSTYYLSAPHVSEQTSAVLSVLIQIKSLTPYLSNETKQLFETIIAKSDPHERAVLKKMVDRFILDKEHFPHDLVAIQEIIDKGHRLKMKVDTSEHSEYKSNETVFNRVKPLSIVYQYYHYYLIFNHGGEIKSCRIIDIISFKDYPSDVQAIENKKPITLEVDKNYYKIFAQSYPVVNERVNLVNGNKRVVINMSREDAFFLCFRLPKKIKIIEPQEYVELFKSDIKNILSVYEDVE